MAIQPIKFLVSPSATATNGSKTVSVTGNVDCSHVYSGTAIALGTRQVVEAVSGTKPDGSGNSVITLRDDWTDPTTTAKLIAFNTIEGLAEAIRRAREVVQASEAALSGNVSYMGDHSAATGNFPAAPGEGLGSQIYRISIAGTISERDYKVGELIYYDQYFTQWRTFFDGLGSAAQRNVGSDTANVPDNQQLNVRLGTEGNLGAAAQRNVMTSPTDIITADALMPRGAFGLAQLNDPYTGNLDDASFGWLLVDASAANNFFGTTCLLFTFSASPVSDRKRQELTHAALNITATRTYDAGVWSSWKTVYNTGNILSPIAFIGSTPAGGLMQLVIVNSSTMYTKFPTQLTTILMSVVVNANSLENSNTGTYGISYYTGVASLVMPLTLLGIRSVSANPVELGALSATARATNANLVDVVVNSKSPASYTVQLTIEGVFAV